MGKRLLHAIIIAFCLVVMLHRSGAASLNDPKGDSVLLVKYRVTAPENELKDPALRALKEIGIRRVIVPPGVDAAAIVNLLKKDPNVEYVEFDHPRKYASIVPNDPGFDSQLNLELINVPQAWEIERGRETVTVALLDTGVDLSHPDLKGRLVQGWDYVNDDSDPTDDSVNSHGTGLAGIIAAGVNNKIGISGVTWGVRIMPMKVLDENGQGKDSNIAAAIITSADRGAQVINISFGGTQSSRTVQEAVQYALRRGTTIVAAAGNDGGPVEYPAAYDGVIAVGAVGIDKQAAYFSNQGPEVDLAAPGIGVVSIKQKSDELMAYHGTSVSAAIVTGVAALVASLQPGIKPAEIESVLRQTAEDINSPGVDQTTGAGLVNAWAALAKVYGGKGEITGSVKFNNINLPGVAVALKGTGLAVKTDLEGGFHLAGLPPGTYEVTAALNGYTAKEQAVTIGRSGGKILLEPFVFGQQETDQRNGELPTLSVVPNIIGYKAPLELRIERSQLRNLDGERPLIGILFSGGVLSAESPSLKNPVIINGKAVQEPLEYLRSHGEYVFRTGVTIPDGEYYIVVTEMGKEATPDSTLGWGRFEISRSSTSPALVTTASMQGAGEGGLVLTNGNSQLELKNAIAELLPGQVAAISFDPLSSEAVKPLFSQLEAQYKRAGQTWIVAGVLADNNGKAEPLSFVAPIILSLPVEDYNFPGKGTLGLYWWNGNGWSYVKSRYDPINSIITGTTAKTGVFTVMSYTPGFTDIEGSSAKNYIEILATRQIIKGVQPNRFAPELTITRGQLAVLLARSLDLKTEKTGNQIMPFNDVKTGYWADKEIKAASTAGLIKGYTDGGFHPEQPVSREQLAAMMVRALNYLGALYPEDSSIMGRFVDGEKVSLVLAGQVGTAVRLGIIQGSGSGFLRPGSLATRADTAVMLYRMMGIAGLN
ncbi:MAG: S8 family serine peptidase [Bacillota bacterium]